MRTLQVLDWLEHHEGGGYVTGCVLRNLCWTGLQALRYKLVLIRGQFQDHAECPGVCRWSQTWFGQNKQDQKYHNKGGSHDYDDDDDDDDDDGDNDDDVDGKEDLENDDNDNDDEDNDHDENDDNNNHEII